MKIAIVTDTYLPQINGVAKTLGKLVDYLLTKGHEVVVLMPYIEHMEVDYIKTIPSYNFPIYPEHKIAIPRQFMFNKFLGQFQPDIIHIATPFTMGFLGLIYANLSKVPFVTSFHTNFDHYSHYFGFGFLEEWIWNLLTWFHNQGQKTYCPSKATYNLLVSKGFTNVEVWTRGIERTLFSPFNKDDQLRKTWSGEDKIFILYVGRVSPEKEVGLLLEVLKKMKNKTKVHLVITGDGPLKSLLEKKAPQNVSFTGFKQGGELAKIYASADIFTFPSRTETFGNVVLEAMASGLPVIGVNSGGVTDIIEHGVNGFLADPGNSSEIARYLDLLIDNSRLRQEISVNAHRSSKKWSWPIIFDKLIDSYQEVIKTKLSKIS